MTAPRPRVYLAVPGDPYPYNIDCPAMHGYKLSGEGVSAQTVFTATDLGDGVDWAIHHLAMYHATKESS